MNKNIIVRCALAAGLSLMFVFTPVLASADTISDLQAQISSLLVIVAQLQAQLKAVQSGTSVSTSGTSTSSGAFCHTFTTNLHIGNTGDEVWALSTALQNQVLINGKSSLTTNFDETLASLVSAFQEKYASEILIPNGLTAGTGFVGGSTRAKLNALYGCGNVTTTTTTVTTKPTITVVSPINGENWALGTTQTIRWNTSNFSDLNVNIALRNSAGVYVLYIATGIPNTGTYTWTIPADFKYGPGSYNMDVSSYDKGPSAFDTHAFNIVSQTTTSAPVINSLSQSSGSGGETITISGNNFYLPPSGYDFAGWPIIEFRQNNQLVGTITGTNIWSVSSTKIVFSLDPRLIANTTAGVYQLSVINNNAPGGMSSNSVPFTLISPTNSLPTISLTLISPNGGETLIAGQTYQIKWNSAGLGSDGINLALANGNSSEIANFPGSTVQQGVIAVIGDQFSGRYITSSYSGLPSMDNTGSFSWTVPAYLPAGSNYYICVTQNRVMGANDCSNSPFTISRSNTTQPSISASLDSGTPQSANITAGTSNVRVFRFRLAATGEDITLRSLNLAVLTNNLPWCGFSNLRLYDALIGVQIGSTVSASEMYTGVLCHADFNNLNIVIPAGTTKVIDLNLSVPSNATSEAFAFSLGGMGTDFSPSGKAVALPTNIVSGNTMTIVSAVATIPAPIITSLSQSSGSGGENITIYGSNFAPNPTINFSQNGIGNGSAYGPSILSVTPTQIVFYLDGRLTANSVPGVYQLSVINNNAPGGMSSNSVPFTFISSILGDTTLNGSISSLDATYVLRHVSGTALLTGQALKNADVDGDGRITTNDSTLILNYVTGLITSFSQAVPPPVVPACSVSDIYATQVPGFVYLNLYMKVNNLPGLGNSVAPVGNVTITGAESWDNLVFNIDGTYNPTGETVLKATQTVNSTGVSYILARKSAIYPVSNGGVAITCAPLSSAVSTAQSGNSTADLANVLNALQSTLNSLSQTIK